MTLDLTVVTPTIVERGDLLGELVAAMTAQTLKPAEWWVSYDTDGRGPAVIRNELVEAATTEWVFPLDDDDLIDPDHFATLAPHLTADADVVWTSPRIPHDQELEHWLGQTIDIWAMDRANGIAGAAAVRRSAWLAVGGQRPEDDAEDWGMWLRLRNAGYRFRQVEATTWTYRLDPAWSHRSRED